MIRVWVEGGLQAIFADDENVTVCREVIENEYIVDERWCEASQLLDRYKDENWDYPLIFLNREQFVQAVRSGIGNGPDDIYRIERVERVSNQPPAFLEGV